MPYPVGKFSTDRFFYDNFNKTSNSLCAIHPNIFTLIAFLLLIPISQNLINDGPIDTAIILVFYRGILDCIDGAQARKCKKYSSI